VKQRHAILDEEGVLGIGSSSGVTFFRR